MYNNANKNSRITLSVLPILAVICSVFLMIAPLNYHQQGALAQASATSRHPITTATATLPIVSTRNHFSLNTAELNQGHNNTDYNTKGNIPGLQSANCPPEVGIYIHGVWANTKAASEQVDRVKLSLNSNRYIIPVVGFTWDSNTDFSPHGWQIAKIIANENGPKLAHFISDYKNKCQNTNIRILAHSLGANVTNSTLVSLDNNQNWKSNGFRITSVHLLGAAINSDTPSASRPFGHAIQRVVDKFYNIYDPRDDLLLIAYPPNEHHTALGLFGADLGIIRPGNYIQQNVAFNLLLSDANGTAQFDCLDYLVPLYDNHCGYMGFRDTINLNSIRDDGVMGLVVGDWNG